MIVVDSSVWIANLRNQPVAAVRTLRDPAIADEILIGNIVLTEVLQGHAMRSTRPGSKPD